MEVHGEGRAGSTGLSRRLGWCCPLSRRRLLPQSAPRLLGGRWVGHTTNSGLDRCGASLFLVSAVLMMRFMCASMSWRFTMLVRRIVVSWKPSVVLGPMRRGGLRERATPITSSAVLWRCSGVSEVTVAFAMHLPSMCITVSFIDCAMVRSVLGTVLSVIGWSILVYSLVWPLACTPRDMKGRESLMRIIFIIAMAIRLHSISPAG